MKMSTNKKIQTNKIMSQTLEEKSIKSGKKWNPNLGLNWMDLTFLLDENCK